MPRPLKLLSCCALAILALAGCGSSAKSSGSSPTQTALSYFPASSPLIVTIATDPNSPGLHGAQALEGKFPFAALGQAALKSKLQQQGINYDADIRPLFGNPVAFGAASATLGHSTGQDFLMAWVTKDAGKLTALVKKLPGIHPAGMHDGATLYGLATSALAVDGPTVVIAPSVVLVDQALDRHAHGGAGAKLPSGLPQNSLVNVFGDLTAQLSQPAAAKALRVPWVAALRSYGAAVNASANGISWAYRLDTTRRALTAAQVPLAEGGGSPQLAGNLPITLSVLNPAHIIGFVEAAEQASSPASYAGFQKRESALKAKTGVDLNSLFALATGDLILNTDTRTFLVRVGLSDPSAAASTLAKLAGAPRSLFKQPTKVTRLGGGFYTLAEAHTTITVGIAGRQLVAGFERAGRGTVPASPGAASPGSLRAFADAPTSAASGAQGTVAFRVTLPELLKLALKRQPPQILQPVLASLGDITGWTAATPQALTGSASLAIK